MVVTVSLVEEPRISLTSYLSASSACSQTTTPLSSSPQVTSLTSREVSSVVPIFGRVIVIVQEEELGLTFVTLASSPETETSLLLRPLKV